MNKIELQNYKNHKPQHWLNIVKRLDKQYAIYYKTMSNYSKNLKGTYIALKINDLLKYTLELNINVNNKVDILKQINKIENLVITIELFIKEMYQCKLISKKQTYTLLEYVVNLHKMIKLYNDELGIKK